MKSQIKLAVLLTVSGVLYAANQTPTFSPVLFQNKPNLVVTIEQEPLQLPIGIQSSAVGVSGDKWLFIAGRKNGLHGFNDDDFNFPKSQQNDIVIVVDKAANTVVSRALVPGGPGISQALFDTLTVTNAQHYQEGNFLYLVGGYGWDVAANDFITQDKLTSINITQLIAWVEAGAGAPAANTFRQISNPTFQVTGGEMRKVPGSPVLLILGQNFTGPYRGSSNGVYTKQIRRFMITDDGGATLSATILPPMALTPDDALRRRDLNIASVTRNVGGATTHSFTALAGVFTTTDGFWTVPVEITADGTPTMADPTLEDTFKQSTNIYASSTIGLFSESNNEMNTLVFGGITYENRVSRILAPDPGLPFTNQVTAITIDKDGNYKQFILNPEFPDIKSTGSNPGNRLLFGAESAFIPAAGVPTYDNGVINMDQILNQTTVVGYIVGGIMSTKPNTDSMSDSTASPYIFKVTLHPYSPLPEFSKALVDKYN